MGPNWMLLLVVVVQCVSLTSIALTGHFLLLIE